MQLTQQSECQVSRPQAQAYEEHVAAYPFSSDVHCWYLLLPGKMIFSYKNIQFYKSISYF